MKSMKSPVILFAGAVLLVAALAFVLGKKATVEPQIHVLNDGPIIFVRTLSTEDVSEIKSLVRREMRNHHVVALRRYGLSVIQSVVNRHLVERIYDIEIERDGSVTVLTRNQAERPPRLIEPGTRNAYSGFGRNFHLKKGTNGWEICGRGSWGMNSNVGAF
jgi:hypothetical protein